MRTFLRLLVYIDDGSCVRLSVLPNLEVSVVMMSRADDLISLALEFLDDLSNPDHREEP